MTCLLANVLSEDEENPQLAQDHHDVPRDLPPGSPGGQRGCPASQVQGEESSTSQFHPRSPARGAGLGSHRVRCALTLERRVASQILDDVDIKGQDIPSKGKAFTKVKTWSRRRRRARMAHLPRPSAEVAAAMLHPPPPGPQPGAAQICYGENGYGPKKLTGVEAYQAMCDATRGCVAFSLDDTDIESELAAGCSLC